MSGLVSYIKGLIAFGNLTVRNIFVLAQQQRQIVPAKAPESRILCVKKCRPSALLERDLFQLLDHRGIACFAATIDRMSALISLHVHVALRALEVWSSHDVEQSIVCVALMGDAMGVRDPGSAAFPACTLFRPFAIPPSFTCPCSIDETAFAFHCLADETCKKLVFDGYV